MHILIVKSYTKIGGDNNMKDKKVEGIHGLANLALVDAITDLSPYYEGRSTLRENYFPIRVLSKAVYEIDLYGQDYIFDEEFSR